MINIYTYPKSRSLRVLWALEELQLAYNPIKVDLLSAAAEVTSPHPQQKVPALEDNGFILFETLAICQYVCQQTNDQTLYPTELKQRAITNQWLSFALTDLEPPIWTLLKHQLLLPANLRNAQVIEVAKMEAQRPLELLAQLTLEPWISGQTFSLADIFIAHNLAWAKALAIPLTDNLNTYLTRCLARPAYATALQKNNA